MSFEVSCSASAADRGDFRGEMQDFTLDTISSDGTHFFGIFDGHGDYGDFIAHESERFISRAVKHVQIYNPSSLDSARFVRSKLRDLDKNLSRDGLANASGSTATIACIKSGFISVVYLGDSEAIYYPDSSEAIPLIEPHTTDNKTEVARVASLGYQTRDSDYFNNVIMVSRAIGNHENDFVIAEAEISSYTIQEAGTLVVASDGVWGKADNDNHADVERLVRQLQSDDTEEIFELASNLTYIMSGRTHDNASAVVARIKASKTHAPVLKRFLRK